MSKIKQIQIGEDTFDLSVNASDIEGQIGGTLPQGGTQGQVLVKNSATDYDTKWENAKEPIIPMSETSYLTNQLTPGIYMPNGTKYNVRINNTIIAKSSSDRPFVFVGKRATGYGRTFVLDATDDNTTRDQCYFKIFQNTDYYNPVFSLDLCQVAEKSYVDGKAIPTGGSTGQVLAKASNTDNDVEWITPSGGALVITSSASTIVEGKAVPKITNEQLTSIYNAIVTDGKTVYIEDSDSEQRFEVTGADTDGTNIFAYMVFAESLLLTYQDSTGTDATITGKAIGGGSKTIDDTHIPIYYAGEIYFKTNSNPWNISKTSEDGIKILNKINEAYHNNDLIFYLQVNNTNFDLPYRNIKILIKMNPTGGTYEKFVPKGYQLYTDISSSDCRSDSVGLPGIGRWQLDENDNWTTTEYYVLSRYNTTYNFAKGDVIKYVYASTTTTTIETDVIPTIPDSAITTLYDRFTNTSTKYDCYVQDSLDYTTSRVLEASLISGAKSISFIFAHRLLLTYTVGATPEVLHLGGTQ